MLPRMHTAVQFCMRMHVHAHAHAHVHVHVHVHVHETHLWDKRAAADAHGGAVLELLESFEGVLSIVLLPDTCGDQVKRRLRSWAQG